MRTPEPRSVCIYWVLGLFRFLVPSLKCTILVSPSRHVSKQAILSSANYRPPSLGFSWCRRGDIYWDSWPEQTYAAYYPFVRNPPLSDPTTNDVRLTSRSTPLFWFVAISTRLGCFCTAHDGEPLHQVPCWLVSVQDGWMDGWTDG